ncbi:MAG: DUF4139 domain-containing protein [Bacteroidota bacterium]
MYIISKNRTYSKLTTILLLILFSQSAFSQRLITPQESTIKDITVFLEAAQVERNVAFKCNAGTNILIVNNLSRYANVQSLQLIVKDQLEIKSIDSESYELNPETINPKLQQLSDSIKLLDLSVTSIDNQIKAYQTEQNLLSNNQKLGTQQSGVSIEDLIKAADFFRKRSLEINTAISSLSGELISEKVKLEALKKRHQLILESIDRGRIRLKIGLESPTAQSTSLTMKYIVDEASWAPNYDLRANSIDAPLELKYKGDIYNDTGVDWKDVALTLSTSNPNLEATRPYLQPWTLNYQSTYNEGRLASKRRSYSAEAEDDLQDFDGVANEGTEVVEDINTEFKIQGTHTILTNTDPYSVLITENELNAEYEYFAIPKVEHSAFLLSKVTGWENLNLITGVAQTYYKDTYIGQSDINSLYFSDTIQFSFGRDNQILVSKAKLKDARAKKFIGTKREESFTYEIRVKNNKKVAITIEIEDQVPVSQESDISVEVQDISGASWNKSNGQLKWKLKLAPNESVRKLISFSVKYPANKSLNIRKSRVIRTPKFRR